MRVLEAIALRPAAPHRRKRTRIWRRARRCRRLTGSRGQEYRRAARPGPGTQRIHRDETGPDAVRRGHSCQCQGDEWFRPRPGLLPAVTLSEVGLVGWPDCDRACSAWRAGDGRRLPVEDPVSEADILPWSLRVSFYPVSSRPAIAGVEAPAGSGAPGRWWWPCRCRRWSGRCGRVRAGTAGRRWWSRAPHRSRRASRWWCTVAVTAPLWCAGTGGPSAGRPCDHARLGAAEQELDRRAGRARSTGSRPASADREEDQGRGAAGDERRVHDPGGAADDR